ncbi:MAG: substrate-binding domain-containing protein [Acidimicrobiales bacterium]|nr:substrate-binding domain-containing protein [Acidimicrobiales bacterium]
MRRLLAIFGAAVMIGLAIVARGVIDDDDHGSGGGGSGSDELVVVCARDLKEACDALEGLTVVLAEAADTAAAITAGELDDDVDAWLTSSAWTEVLAARAPGALADPVAVARTPAVVSVAQPRAPAVLTVCESSITWACLGQNAGAQWGSLGTGDPQWGALKFGLPVADSATGLAVIASVAVGSFGNADFAANDFGGDFAGQVQAIGSGSGPDPDPVATLVTRPGTYTAVGALHADAETVGERAYTVMSEPTVFATAVLVQLRGADRVPGIDRARDALGEAGWSPLPDDADIPPTLKPGVMAALHTLWTETTG